MDNFGLYGSLDSLESSDCPVIVSPVSNGARKVSDGIRKVSDGVKKFSHDVREVSDIVRKVSDGVREVSDGVRKVSGGVSLSQTSAAVFFFVVLPGLLLAFSYKHTGAVVCLFIAVR